MKAHALLSIKAQHLPRGVSSVTRQRHVRSSAGFTLIELLVVFTLLALLLSIAVPRYLQAVDTAREKVRQQNLATMRDALDKFKADQGRYPNELTELVSKQYLRHIPLDPVSGSTEWTPLAHPGGLETGVYDVAPPASLSAPSGEKSLSEGVSGVSPELPLLPGSIRSDSNGPSPSSAPSPANTPMQK